ncbi:hypothetical protein [Azospirillum endophyticum]
MRKANSPLANLLIISAIDLLVCCLTAGIMLFLVYQPSLRADRSSAVLNAGRGADGIFQVPVTIIVKNNSDNQLVPSNGLPEGFEEILAVNASPQAKTRILRVTRAAPPVLTLGAANAAGRVSATITVVADGKIMTKTIDCTSGDQVRAEIDLDANDQISIARCGAPTMCYHYAVVPPQTAPPAWAELCFLRTDGGSWLEKVAAATHTCGFRHEEERNEWVSKGKFLSNCEPTPATTTGCQGGAVEILARRDVPLTEGACGGEP